jgi:hypothetical protein
MGEMRNAYKILVGKPEGKKPLGRRLGLKGVDWIHLAQDRDRWRAFVNTVMNLQVP